MSNITEFEKTIYNCYLKNYRKGEPYRPRRDFSNINPNILASLKKISSFLTRYPHIKVEDYFDAPNSLYNDDKYPPLASFFSRSAIKNYALYQQQKQDRNPDLQHDEIRSSFKFIGLFCVENRIQLEDYLNKKNGYMYCWINHYRENRVNPYTLLAIGNVFNAMERIPKDERTLFAENLEENLLSYWNRFQKSPNTKQFTQELYKKIKIFITNELTITQNLLK